MLFRPEALTHAQQDHAEGTVLLRGPLILWSCSLAALVISIAIACLLATARHSPLLRVSGTVGEDLRARITVPAKVFHHVRIGQRVAVVDPANAKNGGRPDYATVHAVAQAGPNQYRILLDIEKARPAGVQVDIDIPMPTVRLLDWIMHALSARRNQP